MAGLGRILSKNLNIPARFAIGAACAALAITSANNAFADEPLLTKAPALPFVSGAPYNWTGFYAGGNLGVAWGSSNWTAGPGIGGTTDLFQTIDTFDEGGSFFAGVQGGYNYMLPNRVVLGAEVDATFPAWPTLPSGVNPFGVSIGGSSNFTSPALGLVSFAETMLASGSVRGRIGYAPGNWLFYATGGFAWTYNQQSLTQVATGNGDTPFLWRLGWAAGAGAEVPIVPHWTARLQYLFTDYGSKTTQFSAGAQPVSSDFMVHELSLGLNYQFNAPDAAAKPIIVTKAPAALSTDEFSFTGQSTFVWQGYPAIRSPFQGANSLPSGGQGKETFDLTLFAGARLWRGAELWVDPEIDQGHGLAETHGVAGFPSGESYKLGADYPYARVQRYFIRQTIDLGGDKTKIDADVNQFAQSTTENRLELWIGKFSIVDVFDTNKYANNPKTDFMNWALINAGTFDYAGDAWGYTYGAAAEWYQGRFTLRGGAFDLSASPAGGGNNAQAYGLDPTFQQFELVGEIEERHALWEQPGKLKITGYLERGNMGTFSDAVLLSQIPGPLFGDATDALAAVRHYQSRPGVSLNLEQQINDSLGLFARAGWADGKQEPWDFTDIDRTVQAGISINGKSWNRPDDTIGVAGIVNGLDPAHQAYFAAGGLGVLVGDGALPNYGVEQILETYYSYAISPTMKVTFDYQFIANPNYNADRGPVNVFAGRWHATF